MRFLRLSSLSIILAISSCSSAYKNLSVASGNAACIQQFRPAFNSALYNTQVNVVGKHLSGLLLFKSMPDSSMRVVFSSEMGVKFFDFEFGADGSFSVHQVMNQLNKKAVINTLRSDFELLLMRDLQPEKAIVKTDSIDGYTWYGFRHQHDTHYYITTASCDSLVRIEHAMKRKPKVQIVMRNYTHGVPDTIGITHKNFNLEIGLKYIKR
jgi:hypothetical protein